MGKNRSLEKLVVIVGLNKKGISVLGFLFF
jgi:hypothetical protein